jgi:hypothetical protein
MVQEVQITQMIRNMKKIFLPILSLIIAIPAIASAQISPTYIQGYSASIIGIINNYLVPVLLAAAFLVFLWGVFKQFIWKAESGEAHTEGAKFVATGIIGFVIILCLWGLVNIVKVTLFNSSGASLNRPNPPIF